MVEYVNRRGDTYFLHEGRTKTGKPKYYFSRKRDGLLAATVPGGFEIYETPDAIVSLRKIPPRLVTAEEVAVVERCARRFVPHVIVDVKGKSIVVHTADNALGRMPELMTSTFGLPADFFSRPEAAKFLTFTAMLRFTLLDEQARLFGAERYCFKGSIDNWIWLAPAERLESHAARYCPHLGRESFFELI